MIYAYRCRSCGVRTDSTERADNLGACGCGSVMLRDWAAVQVSPQTFKPHFNHSVGMHVDSARAFDDALKQRAEENTAATGVEHSYAPIYPGDMQRPTADDEIFNTSEKLTRDAVQV